VVFEANENDEKRNWLFRQLDGCRDENTAKARRIEEFQHRVEQLEAELKAERQKQFKAVRPEEEDPSPGVVGENRPKKRGVPPGHPGWFRPTPTHIDRTLDVPAASRCPYCEAAVLARPDLAPYEHIQEDFLDGQRSVTCYRHEQGRCTNPNCRLWVHQPGEGEILRCALSAAEPGACRKHETNAIRASCNSLRPSCVLIGRNRRSLRYWRPRDDLPFPTTRTQGEFHATLSHAACNLWHAGDGSRRNQSRGPG
jgi:hypothetical protein